MTFDRFDNLPPHSLEAEMCTLSAMMLAGDNPAMLASIRASIGRDDFFQADHQIIFDVICACADQNGAVDAMLVREDLIRRELLEEIGGIDYLARILNEVPNAANGAHYAGIVREKATLRRIIGAASDTLRRCYAPMTGEGPDDIAREFLAELHGVCRGRASQSIVKFDRLLADVMQTRRDGVATRIGTGLRTLDEICGGLPKGGYTILAGRPSMGKSQLGKQVVKNVARSGIAVGIVSCEETLQKIGQNYLSGESGVENNRIAYGNCDEREWGQIEAAAVPAFTSLPIFATDKPVRLGEVESAITTLVTRYGCELVFVDYLQLIDAPGAQTKEQEIAKVSIALKHVFKGLGAAGLVAAQLSRANETGTVRRPELRDLRHSGQIEQDGDVILLLHREDYYHYKQRDYAPNHVLEVNVAKNKDGPMGTARLHFEGKYQTVKDRANEGAPDCASQWTQEDQEALESLS
jgi:replicative DNA helicase